ncbi:MAG: cyclopropane-fatty-acyl-phospholipid synthase [Syntrophomonadaceae bacterium]|nr:cyclopropane-fatty-acyl-phospholipid synthase [Syntrophomonadaceae bacterium]
MQKSLLQNSFKRVNSGVFEVTYWDGTTEQYGKGDPSFKLVFHEKVPYGRIVKDPLLAFGEAYMDGAIDISGEIDEIIKFANSNMDVFGQYRKGRILPRILSRWPLPTPLRKQLEDVQYHYDLGNGFFSLWLDKTMSYSCAYFQSPNDSLTQAQIQKIDYVLKKLQLSPRETLLDIGSGWGWLIIRAAQEYGVKATGITLSREQYRETLRRIVELGLEDRVEVELMDYRILADSGRTFDKISSVGMFEHVGQANYPHFMLALQKLLKEGGLALLHTITHTKEGPVNSWIEKHIFPGGYIPSLREVIWLLPNYGFHVIDVESLRLHYAMTLERWAEGFEKHVDKVQEMYGDRFVRMWRLYLRSCAASFRVSGQNVHQIIFSKGLNNSLPLTRRHLYI